MSLEAIMNSSDILVNGSTCQNNGMGYASVGARGFHADLDIGTIPVPLRMPASICD